ncbi:pyruvate formate lyase family protein, partial [Clostridioides difficile]|uniref:pyruvate formate lyase family protein n=1 Tax=Clostridioides difficile TaxID=1496 RepID=UPI003F8D236C
MQHEAQTFLLSCLRTPQPSLTMLYDEKLPEDFLMKAAECTKLGSGYPAWVNNSNGT